MGRSPQVRDQSDDGAFVVFSEPLPVGTPIALKIDDKERPARVTEVVESGGCGGRGHACSLRRRGRTARAGARACTPGPRRPAGCRSAAPAPAPVVAEPPPPARAPAPAAPAPAPVVAAAAPAAAAPAAVARGRAGVGARARARACRRRGGLRGRPPGHRFARSPSRRRGRSPPPPPEVIRAPRLAPGDPVRVIAPSGLVPREAFAAGLEVLRARYEVRHDDGVFAREGYLAGPDERRLAELNAALADPDARAIVMARGGYGLMRLLPFIDIGALVSRPRPIVGFSDGTALLALAARAGVAAIHGPVVTQLGGLGARDQRALFERLEEPGPGLLLDGMEGADPGARARAAARREPRDVLAADRHSLHAGCLGAIVFFEDLGELAVPHRLIADASRSGGRVRGGERRGGGGFLRLSRAGGDARGLSDGGRGADRAAGPPSHPGRRGWRVRPRHPQPRAPLRHDVRARHARGDADRPRRRGQLIDVAMVAERQRSPVGRRQPQPQAANDGPNGVSSVNGTDERRAREPAQSAHGGEPLLPQRE